MKKRVMAVIGCGTIANSAHIPAYMAARDIAEVKYFCDIIPERAQAAVERYGSGIAVTDYHVICDDPEVEACSVCTPNYVHAPITIDLLNAGKDVLCEKPASVNSELAAQMQAAADKNDRILDIGVVNRYNTAVNKIKELIEQGALGKVYHVYCSFRAHRSIPGLGGYFTTKKFAGGGVLIDWGVHYLDLILYVLGQPKAQTVSAKCYSEMVKGDLKDFTYVNMWAGPPKYDGVYDVDDFCTGFIRTEGPTITFNGAWAQNIGEAATFIEFLGDKAGIKLTYGGNFTMYSTQNGMLTEITPEYNMCSMFNEEIRGFVTASATHTKSRGSIDNAILTSRLMDDIYESSEKGMEIKAR